MIIEVIDSLWQMRLESTGSAEGRGWRSPVELVCVTLALFDACRQSVPVQFQYFLPTYPPSAYPLTAHTYTPITSSVSTIRQYPGKTSLVQLLAYGCALVMKGTERICAWLWQFVTKSLWWLVDRGQNSWTRGAELLQSLRNPANNSFLRGFIFDSPGVACL